MQVRIDITAEQFKNITANQYYYNLHTEAFPKIPDGEIRANLIWNTGPAPSVEVLGNFGSAAQPATGTA
eukprot:tig00000157_g9611.t1